jgi:hypothetical protein
MPAHGNRSGLGNLGDLTKYNLIVSRRMSFRADRTSDRVRSKVERIADWANADQPMGHTKL